MTDTLEPRSSFDLVTVSVGVDDFPVCLPLVTRGYWPYSAAGAGGGHCLTSSRMLDQRDLKAHGLPTKPHLQERAGTAARKRAATHVRNCRRGGCRPQSPLRELPGDRGTRS